MTELIVNGFDLVSLHNTLPHLFQATLKNKEGILGVGTGYMPDLALANAVTDMNRQLAGEDLV